MIEDIRQEDMAEMLYQMCNESSILDFGVIGKGEVLTPECLQK